jgi:hypothetical protein
MEDQERVRLLNDSGRWFHGRVQEYMRTDMILRISRLTDAAKSRSQTNLTLDTLLTDPMLNERPELATDLRARIAGARERAAGVRKYRHKQIAHTDHAAALGDAKTVIGNLTIGEIREVVTALEDVYNVHGTCTRGVTAFLHVHAGKRQPHDQAA